MENRWMAALVTMFAVGCGEPSFYGDWEIEDVVSICDVPAGFGTGDPMNVDASGMWDEDFAVDFRQADDPFDRFHGCVWIDEEVFVCDAPCWDHEDPSACDEVCVPGQDDAPCPELSGTWTPEVMTLTLQHPTWEDLDETGPCLWTAEAAPPIYHSPWRPFDLSALGGMGQ